MGFSVQLVLVRGRPDEVTLARWATTARPRRPNRGPVLAAAPAWSGSFSLLYFDAVKKEAPMLEPMTVERAGLPSLPADELIGEADRFLLTIALLAREDGVDAAYLGDSSISDCGQLIVAGGQSLSWDADTCEAGRAEADALLQSVFGETVPDVDELDWVGADTEYWSRRLPPG